MGDIHRAVGGCAGIATFVGLRAARTLGLKTPIVDAPLHGEPLQTGLTRTAVTAAGFYGGIGEEIQLRLFLLSILALTIRHISHHTLKTPAACLPGSVFWSANLLAALFSGLGHLPATAEIMPLAPLVIVRAIILNGLVGVVAGYLFWKRGLEMAMLYRFSADIVLHVLIPL